MIYSVKLSCTLCFACAVLFNLFDRLIGLFFKSFLIM